ncbi:VWA domain-containing protein [Sporosarcina sp. FA9]|uniref:VWA domain-containing protein n=1 Tax=Sporosarcina sp. FA9 TaxID=3413030 RepID=UPI003F65AD50
MDIRIDQPLWLLLLIPIIIYIAFTWKSSALKLKSRGMLLFVLRSFALILLVFALTVPYFNLKVEEEQVLFVVDRSISIDDGGLSADKWIAESLKYRNEKQSVGLYSFAKNFRTDTLLTDASVSVSVLEDIDEKDATDIAKAIDMATSVANKDFATRIVLVSDGNETVGSALDLLPKFSNGRIQIDTLLVDVATTNDASITVFETPKTSYSGEKQLLQVEIDSSSKTVGELYIYRNDLEVVKQTVELEPGNNAFSYRIDSAGEGLLKYEAKIIVDNDRFLENNRMLSVTIMESSPRVLIVETKRNPSNIPALLDQEAIDIDVVSAEELPENLSGYLGYGAIIFDNVPGHTVGENKMAMIEQAVKSFGTGFMMVGGDESFGLGGYFKSPIERILPVEMEVKGKEQLPSLGLMIVMDRSGSMSGQKIVLAREAAARSVELLRDDDTFGFIAFDHQVWDVIPVGPLGNKEEAIEKILSVPAAGGTDIFPGMKKAYEDLEDLNLQRKHIILLTDGQSPMPPDYEDVLSRGKEHNITMSTVAIGSDADVGLLESLAENGGGRFYDVVDESTVPAILSRETAMITRTYIEDNPFYMTLGNVPEWTSLFKEGVPEINAYIATTPKSTATIIGESPKEDPVIAEWMYGLGRTVAFTSDSSGKWGGDLARWSGYSDFWNTAIARLLPSYLEVPYIITHEQGGNYTVTDSSRQAAFLDIAIVDEAGKEVPFTSEPLAPGKVRVSLDAKPGLVFFGVTDDRGGLFEAGVSVPYSEEYKPLRANAALMEKIATQTGGIVLDSPADAFRSHPFKSAEKRPIAQWLILTAMILFFLDITLRRFGMFKGFGARRVPESNPESIPTTEDTVSELLKSKRKR